ncbi:MAG: LysR family transcriptional regulator [Oscillospiraceae bacterium]|nr:LysR family transcriptional regulator [Oscillospiraceae bacterium]
MTIRLLKIFIKVAETQNMTTAASQLYLAQSTVSQAIRELEEHYGAALFSRLSKRLYITEAGKHLLYYAKSVVSKFDQLEYSMRKDCQVEHLRLGTTITVASSLLPSILNQLKIHRPHTEWFSLTANTAKIEQKILKNELDVGIVEGEIKSPDLIRLPLVHDRLVLACAAGHPLAAKHEIGAADLEKYPFVMREKGSGTRELFLNTLKQKGISIQIKVEAPFPEAMRNAILYNDCLAAISIRLLENEIKAGTVKIFLNRSGAWDRTFKLVYHKDAFLTESISFLTDLLKKYKSPNKLEIANDRFLTL